MVDFILCTFLILSKESLAKLFEFRFDFFQKVEFSFSYLFESKVFLKNLEPYPINYSQIANMVISILIYQNHFIKSAGKQEFSGQKFRLRG